VINKFQTGHLSGDSGNATCQVIIDSDGVPYVREVSQSLPNGEYQLSIGSLQFKVRHFDGEWLPADGQ
jgi:hypothetical protein